MNDKKRFRDEGTGASSRSRKPRRRQARSIEIKVENVLREVMRMRFKVDLGQLMANSGGSGPHPPTTALGHQADIGAQRPLFQPISSAWGRRADHRGGLA